MCVCVYVCVSELPTCRRATSGVGDKGVLDLPPRHRRVGDKVLWPVDLVRSAATVDAPPRAE